MKRFSKLIRLNRYLKDFSLPENYGIVPIRAVETGDATTRLAKASGYQVVIARPECVQEGDTDGARDFISTAFFVLYKVNGAARTQEKEDECYDTCLEIAEAVVGILSQDITCGDCQLIGSLDISSVNIVPVYSVFGGWSGYSLEIQFE